MRGRLALLLTGIVVAVSACAPAGSPASPAGTTGSAGQVTVQAWGWNQDPAWKQSVEAFNASQTAVKVEYRGYKADEYNTVLQTGLSGQSGPDVMMLRSYGGLETVAAAGLLEPLNDRVSALSGFAKPVLAGATSIADGKVYGVPFAIQTGNIQYNKKIFADQGIAVPTTWAEFIAACDKLSAAGITPMSATYKDSWTLPILRDTLAASLYGGPAFADELVKGTATFTDARYTKANQALLDLKKYFPKAAAGMSYDDSKTLFVSGKAAMFPGGIWELSQFRAANKDLDIGIFNAPPVEGSGPGYAMGYVDGSWGMSKAISDDRKAAATTFLSWIASAEYGTKIADDLLQLPVVPGVVAKDPLLAQVGTWYEANPTPYLTYVNFDYGTPSGTELEYGSLQKMMLGQIDAAQVGKDLNEGISQWFKPRQ